MPKLTPKVSVVITCYNYGRYLADCLNSVLKQTFQDFEIIIVDDGSTDDTFQVVQPFLSLPRLTFIQQKNGGQANAKNRGIRESKGTYIAFLDADDMWHPEKLSKQVPLFSDPKVGVAFSRATYIDECGNNLNIDITQFNKYLQPKQGMVLKYLLCENFVPFSSSIVRRCLIMEGFNERIKMGIDWELWLKLSLQYEFREVPEKLLFYRMGHPGQMSKNQEERFRSTDVIWDEFTAMHAHRIRKAWINGALAYRYFMRADYYSMNDTKLAITHFLNSIYKQPFFLPAWKELIKLLLFRGLPPSWKTIKMRNNQSK